MATQNVKPSKPYIIPIITTYSSNNNVQEKLLSISRSAIFVNNKMVGTMSHDLSYGPQILNNTFWQTVYSVTLNKSKIGLNIQNVKTKLKPMIRNGHWIITARVSGQGIIFEDSTSQDLLDQKTQRKIEYLVEKKMELTIKKSVILSQNLKSDVFNFYTIFYRKYPLECLQVKSSWNDIFAHIEVIINTKFQITHVGINQQ